jgi:hypothetical protein
MNEPKECVEALRFDRKLTTEELREEFEVLNFSAPYVMVRHKATGQKGSMMFEHNPRIYYGFAEVTF